jgi:hypothetical protein
VAHHHLSALCSGRFTCEAAAVAAAAACRQLNEALYTQPGNESLLLMQQQPELFQQYHEGFQQQVVLQHSCYGGSSISPF